MILYFSGVRIKNMQRSKIAFTGLHLGKSAAN